MLIELSGARRCLAHLPWDPLQRTDNFPVMDDEYRPGIVRAGQSLRPHLCSFLCRESVQVLVGHLTAIGTLQARTWTPPMTTASFFVARRTVSIRARIQRLDRSG